MGLNDTGFDPPYADQVTSRLTRERDEALAHVKVADGRAKHAWEAADVMQDQRNTAETERDALYWALFCAPFAASAWTLGVLSIWERHAADMAEAASTSGELRDALVEGLKKLIDGAEERDGHLTIKARAVNRLINRLGLR